MVFDWDSDAVMIGGESVQTARREYTGDGESELAAVMVRCGAFRRRSSWHINPVAATVVVSEGVLNAVIIFHGNSSLWFSAPYSAPDWPGSPYDARARLGAVACLSVDVRRYAGQSRAVGCRSQFR